ncbi:MAG: hypothetical protein IKX63_06335 [Muribaculaceae bacterium]|nr:hypothetical protein [Muribaculaceae bacterium]
MAIILPLTFESWGKDNDEQVTHKEHVYVDLGLPSGTLWATCNVGANSPEEYGDYFAWGETEPKEKYDPVNYKWGNGIEVVTKYVNNYSATCRGGQHINNRYEGYVDNKLELDPEDDAAYVNWGPQWRMPSKAQQDELVEMCTWIWTLVNSVEGYLVTGPNGHAIFFPAAGMKLGDMTVDTGLHTMHPFGYYSSRTLSSQEPFCIHIICFKEAAVIESGTHYVRERGVNVINNGTRYEGYTVRAVRVSQD